MASLETLYTILDEILVDGNGIDSERFWAIHDVLNELAKLPTSEIVTVMDIISKVHFERKLRFATKSPDIEEEMPIVMLDRMTILPYFNKITGISDHYFDNVVSKITIVKDAAHSEDPSYRDVSKRTKKSIKGSYIINEINIPVTGYVIIDGDNIIESEINTIHIPDGYHIKIRKRNRRIEYFIGAKKLTTAGYLTTTWLDRPVVMVERTLNGSINELVNGRKLREYKVVNTCLPEPFNVKAVPCFPSASPGHLDKI